MKRAAIWTAGAGWAVGLAFLLTAGGTTPPAVDREGIRCTTDTHCQQVYGLTLDEAMDMTAPAAARALQADTTFNGEL